MNYTRIIFLLITSIIVVKIFHVNAISPLILNIQQRAQDVLDQQMQIINSKTTLSLNLRSSSCWCHSHYSKLLEHLLETYATNLEHCIEIENEHLLEFITEGQLNREIITKTLIYICDEILEGCKAIEKNLEFFDCVDLSGAKCIRGVWEASKDSSENAAALREKIHDIKYQTARCISDAERGYIVETAEVTDDMMKCYADAEEKDQVEELEAYLKNHNEF